MGKLALRCPAVPSVNLATVDVDGCRHADEHSSECDITCDEGYGAVTPVSKCINGAWFLPEYMPMGSMLRISAMGPSHIKPHWVILDAALYKDLDCTSEIEMKGQAISSGEF